MDLNLPIKDISLKFFNDPLYLRIKSEIKSGKWICSSKNQKSLFIKRGTIEEFQNLQHAEKIPGVDTPKLIGKYSDKNDGIYIISEFIPFDNLEQTYKRDIKSFVDLFKRAVEILAKIHSSINTLDDNAKNVDLIRDREKNEIGNKLSNIILSFNTYQRQQNGSKILQRDIEAIKIIDIERLIEKLYYSNELVYQHGDYKPDNLLVTDDNLIIVDWQGARAGSGWYDLAYLLADVDDSNHLKTKEFIDFYFQNAQQLNLYKDMQANQHVQCFTYGRIYQEIIRTHSNISLKTQGNIEQYETGIKNLVEVLNSFSI